MHKTSRFLTPKPNKVISYSVLLVLLFAPLASQHIIVLFQNHGISFLSRLTVHIIIPVIVTSWLFRQTLWQAFTLPLKARNKELLYWSIKTGFLFGLLAIVIIMGAFLVFQNLLDLASIKASLAANFQVTKSNYPAIALAIVVGTPFFEEYFWRGFIYRSFSELATTRKMKNIFMVFTGVFFALHHVVIVSNWFNWWQFLLTVVFLAIVGIVFNWMYDRTGFILAGLITHVIADIVIVLIGFHVFGFF